MTALIYTFSLYFFFQLGTLFSGRTDIGGFAICFFLYTLTYSLLLQIYLYITNHPRWRPQEPQFITDRILTSYLTIAVCFYFILLGYFSSHERPQLLAMFMWLFYPLALIYIYSHNFSLLSYIEPPRQLVTDGPYTYLRHPFYCTTLCYYWILPILFDAMWALTFFPIIWYLTARRIRFEELILSRVPGYKEYQKQTPYKVLVGIW